MARLRAVPPTQHAVPPAVPAVTRAHNSNPRRKKPPPSQPAAANPALLAVARKPPAAARQATDKVGGRGSISGRSIYYDRRGDAMDAEQVRRRGKHCTGGVYPRPFPPRGKTPPLQEQVEIGISIAMRRSCDRRQEVQR